MLFLGELTINLVIVQFTKSPDKESLYPLDYMLHDFDYEIKKKG